MSFFVGIDDKKIINTTETFVTLDGSEAQAKNFSIIAINEVGESRPVHYFLDNSINRVATSKSAYKIIL